ncbi:type II secretion system protein GspD [Cellvibrio sp. KB43]|uniref:Type II secretion system protein GspD n=2 Tax=Cellvibrio polysaccharolyticus TaxID=2082724 RepID=A0A928VA78_9GAMM|nr:type II secretion system protein GspD [Cellvibrio polysaccharolyticus]
MVLTLSGCAGLYSPKDDGAVETATVAAPTAVAAKAQSENTRSPALERSEPTLLKGTDRQINLPAARQSVALTGDAVTLNFEEAPLTEVVHAVLGDILGLDYMIEHPVEGQITLRTKTPVPRDQLLEILESLLQANNAYILRDKNNRFVVSSSPAMSKLRPAFDSAANRGAGFSNIIVPLQYIGAAEMADILRPVADENSFVRVDPARNLLVLAGRRNQLDGWLDIISTFDIDMLKGMSVGLFPLKESNPTEAEATLKAIMETALGAESGMSSLIRIVPMERLNSLMVITPRAHYLEKVREWLDRVDQQPDDNNERRLFVYSVQNTSAAHIARMMSTIFSDSSGSGTQSGGGSGGGVAPGLTPTRIGEGSDGVSGSGTSSGTGSTTNRNSSGGESANVSIGKIRMVADEKNNSLLIYSTRNEYRKIEAALGQLDIMPTQVHIEATILEVTLTEELTYGLSWYLNNNLGNGWRGVGEGGAPASGRPLTSTGTTGAVSGLAYSIYDSVGDLRTIINALASKSLVNILSSPTVTVLDNEPANIQVGQQQPVQSGSAVTDGGVVSNSITYKDTGVVLDVTPSVNSGGMVTLTVKQSITDVGEIEAATGQRPFLNRDLSTKVAVRSGEAAVLGGLIRENTSDGRAGIPVLRDLPILGNFFGSTSKTKNRTELLVMITPRVLNNEQDLRDVSREMRNRLKGLKLVDETEPALEAVTDN